MFGRAGIFCKNDINSVCGVVDFIKFSYIVTVYNLYKFYFLILSINIGVYLYHATTQTDHVFDTSYISILSMNLSPTEKQLMN